MATVIYDKPCTHSSQVLRLGSGSNWANYLFSASCMNDSSNGRHVVVVPSSQRVQGGVMKSSVSGHPDKTRINFTSAAEALSAMREFLGVEAVSGLSVANGYITRDIEDLVRGK